MLFNLVMLFVAVSETLAYSNLLNEADNRNAVYSGMGYTPTVQRNISVNTPVTPVTTAHPNPVQYAHTRATATVTKVDINTADEATLENLPGLNVIDVQKVLNHRKEHGGFSSVDEFFDVLNLKPHIIVNLRDYVFVSRVDRKPSDVSQSGTRRRIDL